MIQGYLICRLTMKTSFAMVNVKVPIGLVNNKEWITSTILLIKLILCNIS